MPDISIPPTRGYLAIPAGTGRWPGVVVIHEVFGLNEDVRKHADRLAAAGYLALAPDLFQGRPWARCVRSAIRQLHARSGPAFDALEAARDLLAKRVDSTGKTGVIGFCMGGAFALLLAPGGEYSAAAVNYGEVPKDAAQILAGSCPIIASYGGRDMMGEGHPKRLEAALTALDVPHEVKVYPKAGHSFMSPKPAALKPVTMLARMDYKPEDAEDAWRRILAFFSQYLSSAST